MTTFKFLLTIVLEGYSLVYHCISVWFICNLVYVQEIGDRIQNENFDDFLNFLMISNIQTQEVTDFQLQKINERAGANLKQLIQLS